MGEMNYVTKGVNGFIENLRVERLSCVRCMVVKVRFISKIVGFRSW